MYGISERSSPKRSEDNVEKKKQKQAKGLTAHCAAQDANETETENVAGSRLEKKWSGFVFARSPEQRCDLTGCCNRADLKTRNDANIWSKIPIAIRFTRENLFSIKSSIVTIKSVNDRLHLIHHKSTQFSNRFWINAVLRHSLHHQRKKILWKIAATNGTIYININWITLKVFRERLETNVASRRFSFSDARTLRELR